MLHYFFMGRDRSLSFTVHEAPERPADRIARAEALTFVRDGFTWPAFLWGPGWLLEQKIWTGLLAYAGVIAALSAAWWIFDAPWQILALVLLAVHLLIGSEADELARAQLTARGWTLIGQVTGTSALDCERRFFDRWLGSVPINSPGELGGQIRSATNSGTSAVAVAVPAQATAAGTLPQAPKRFQVLGNLLAPRHRDKS